MRIPGGFDAVFRQLSPLVVLGVVVVVVGEPWIPGTAWLRAQFGDAAVLRLAVAILGLYVLLLWGEAVRLHTMLTGVLHAFREFADRGRSPGDPPRNRKARLDAARLLIAALRSDDAAIRATSRHNLTRLVGQDLGADPDAWQRWLAAEEARPTDG